MNQTELRRIPDTDFRADAEAGTFSGLASHFRSVDSYQTTFVRGAFRKTVNDHALEGGGSKIPAVWFHDPEKMVGPLPALAEDKEGLRFTARAVEDGQSGAMVLAHLRAGSPLGMSFAFRRIKDRAATEQDGIELPAGMKVGDVRAITEVEVREISVLPWTFASNSKAVITDIRAADLPTLMDAIRSGTVTDDQATLLDQLVTEWTERAAAGKDHGTPGDPVTHRNYDAEYGLLMMELGMKAA